MDFKVLSSLPCGLTLILEVDPGNLVRSKDEESRVAGEATDKLGLRQVLHKPG